MKRIGVFLCHCGSNIAGTVDVDRVAEAARRMPGVVYVEQNKYTCSEPGQEQIRKGIKEHRLDRVVVAACSPRMHENTFRRTVETAGLNPYLLEIANVREHCSWVHHDREKATAKAIDLVRRAVAKVAFNRPLQKASIPVEKRALVIGGGVAGIQAALDIAEAGHEVWLVEREPSIGGRMAQLDKTFPTLDCSMCILTPKMVDVAQHPNIHLLTYSEVTNVGGYVGNFQVTIRKKARSVDEAVCTGCGTCWAKCPHKVPSEFDLGLGQRKVIYVPFPQAVPNKPVIDRDHCVYFKTGKCRVCEKFCPAGAIRFDQEDEYIEQRFGAIVVATGFDLFDYGRYGEYGGGHDPDIISGLHFERLVNASGPTEGKIKRPSDGKVPRSVAFLTCVGSRDDHKGISYCSRVCCMYTAKHAILLAEKVPGCRPYVFYMDMRTPGKGYEEFYKRSQEMGTQYIRGRVGRIYREGDHLVVQGEDTLLGRKVRVEADMVVLATGITPRQDAGALARTLGISYDQYAFFNEAHPKLRPVETNTAGIYLAGVCQGPKDIPDTVSQASGAAAKVTAMFSRDSLTADPLIATVDEAICSGCLWCKPICPYKAIDEKIITERVQGRQVSRRVATVNAGLCQGCGACTVACRDGAMNLLGFSNQQVLAEVEALCR
ncbi:MAG TPA: CoB--CoM heterodisulfide reductase iron-sulfur subunit A family protein [Firmicutes bacterium]|nr:CoB--CoM heterodisulfide reductase iron-sulfur subunit A family protein [Bacillota bacterium]